MKTDIKGASKTRPAAKKALPSAPQPKSARPFPEASLRPGAAAIARRLTEQTAIPVADILSIAVHAGIEAIAEAMERDREIKLPAKLHMAPTGRRAVFIREDDFRQVVRAGELVGLEDPANTFAADIITNIVDDPGNLLEVVGAIAANYRSAKEGGEE